MAIRKFARHPGVYGSRTNPKPAFCSHCKKGVLSASYDALPRLFDPQPLSSLGELEALFLGLKTWHLTGDHLYTRNAWIIKASPHGTGGIIVRDHECNRPQPTGISVNFPKARTEDPGF